MRRLTLFFLTALTLAAQGNVNGIANQNLNGIPQTNLIGQYLPRDISGTTMTDSSGAGNHGTLVGSPTSTAAALTLSRASTQYFTLPNAVRDNWKSLCIAGDFVQNSVSNFGDLSVFVGSSANNFALAWNYVNGGDRNVSTPRAWTGGGTISLQAVSGPGTVCFVTNGAGNDQWYINGKEVFAYSAQGSSNSVTNFGGGAATMEIGADTGNGALESYNGNIYGVWIYSGSLTAAQVETIHAEAVRFTSLLGATYTYLNATTNSPLICIGDSITAGQGLAQSLCQNSNVSPGDTYTTFSNGISGITAVQLSQMTDWTKWVYAPLAQHNTVLFFAGTNDASAANAESAIRSACAKLRAQGFQVIVATLLSRAGEGALQQPVSAWIRANWRSFADAIVDFSSDTRLGGTSAYTSTVYFQDGVHPTLFGQNIMGAMLTNAINALNGATLPGCRKTTITNLNEGFNVASTTASIQVALPQQYSRMVLCEIKHSTAFAGTGLTSMTVSLGDSVSTTEYCPAQNIFSAVSTTNFISQAPSHAASTITAAPPVINAVFTGNTNLGQGSITITAATNANPPVFTSTANGLAAGNTAYITGFTGNWAPENGECVVSATGLTSTTFECSNLNGTTPPNATGFGAIAGSPIFTSNFLTAGSVDLTLCSIAAIQ